MTGQKNTEQNERKGVAAKRLVLLEDARTIGVGGLDEDIAYYRKKLKENKNV